MIKVSHLTFDYGEKPLLKNINFHAEKSTILHIKGHNGSGKTTLLKLLAGLLIPITGYVTRPPLVCYLGHQNGVHARLTPAEHLYYDLGVTDSSVQAKYLRFLNLFHNRNLVYGLLSAGQKRRVGLLKLLAANATCWLLDEPLVGLDEQGVEQLGIMMKQHLNAEGSIILTSHQPLRFVFEKHITQREFSL